MVHQSRKKRLAKGSCCGAVAILVVAQLAFLTLLLVALSNSEVATVRTAGGRASFSFGADSGSEQQQEGAGGSAGADGSDDGGSWQDAWSQFNFREFWNELVERMQAHVRDHGAHARHETAALLLCPRGGCRGFPNPRHLRVCLRVRWRPQEDPYDVLGVARDASWPEIKKACVAPWCVCELLPSNT